MVYRLEVDGRDHLVTARLFPQGRSRGAYERAVAQGPSPATGRLRPVGHDPDLGAVWWTFPHDRKLGDLGWLTRPDARPGRELRAAGMAADRGGPVRPRALASPPGPLDGAARTLAYAKAYGPAADAAVGGWPARTARSPRRCVGPATRSALPTPWLVGRRGACCLMEAMPGRPWSALAGDARRACRRRPRPGRRAAARQRAGPTGLPALRPAPPGPGAAQRRPGRPGAARRRPAQPSGSPRRLRATIRRARAPASSCTATATPATRSSTATGGPDRPRPDGPRPGGGRPGQPARPAALRGRGRRARCGRRRPSSRPRFLSGYAERRPLPAARRCAWHTAAALWPSGRCAPSTGSTGPPWPTSTSCSPPPTTALDHGVLP